ncbi:MAG: hypothetical protein C0393_08135 [Anaerolinea sp.]|nr:hypothetical protein [Anaerolinea sp.]
MDNANFKMRRVRALLIFFIFALTVSGITAIPLRWELGFLNRVAGPESAIGQMLPRMAEWIGRVNEGVQTGYGQYPFLAYGTDWLAFGHIVIAIAFIGPLRDPLKNRWVIEFGMLACVLIIPWSILLGSLRGIPLFWMMIDMSFGVFGIIPLWFVRREILVVEKSKGWS